LRAQSPEPARRPALVLVADPHLGEAATERIRELHRSGAEIIAWQHSRIVQDRFPSPDVSSALAELSVPHRTIAEALGEECDFAVDEAVIAWMKELGRASLGGKESFRERFRLGPLVLWWWAELYLYHETPLRLQVRDVEALARLAEARKPERIVLVRPVRALEAAARNLAAEVEVVGSAVEGPPFRWRTRALHAADFVKMVGTGLKSVLRSAPRPLGTGGEPRVFFLTHASMWRRRRDPVSGEDEVAEIYFDRILPAVEERASASVIAFGPPVPFRERRFGAWLADLLELASARRPYRSVRAYFSPRLALSLRRDFRRCRELYRELLRTEGLDRALSHRGVPLGAGPIACLRDTFLRQFPWAIRSYREVAAAIEVEKPQVMVLYAESSGLGRAAIRAARDHGVKTVAIQHGIMYPQYYSHEHAPDEVGGDEAQSVPIPDRTAVFGELAKEILVKRGSYPEEAIVVTGSPKFDALVKAASGYDRDRIREAASVPEGARLLVLATRWSAVRPVFAELAAAVQKLEGVFLLVKPHQAESRRPYQEVLARFSSTRTRILSAGANLLELLFASDGLITVDSLASSEALVLGRPVLVVNLPSNLGSLVSRGVALGVPRGESIEKALRALLFDAETGRALSEKRRNFIQEFAFGADGSSTERIVELILSTGSRSMGRR
jgi:hypothetical protein